MRFWFWRVRVSYWGWHYWRRIGAWGFCDDDMDRDAFEMGYSPEEYFIEAWCRD